MIAPELLLTIAEHLTLRELFLYSIALGRTIEFPGRIWAKALQDAVPCCTGIPVDRTPEFYLGVAKWYFNPDSMSPIGVQTMTQWAEEIPLEDRRNLFADLDEVTIELIVCAIMERSRPCFFTKKGRALAKRLLLEMKDMVQPLYDHAEYHDLIDRIVAIFNYRFVLEAPPGNPNRYRLTAGDFPLPP